MPRIGVLLNNFLPVDVAQEGARLAEERGYDICWMTETSSGYGKDAASQLAAVALATSRIKLGPAIMPIYTRTPTLIAQTATSLDEISNGRFILGLGAGHGPNLGQNHGINLRSPFKRMRECVHILREALDKGTLTFKGEIFDIPNLNLLVPNPQRKVPIYLAALGPKMAEFAASVADGIILNMATPEYIREVVPRIKEGARRAGRDPSQVDIACLILSCADGDEGEQMCRRRIANYLLLPFYRNHLSHIGFAPEVEQITQGLQSGGLEEGAKKVSDRLLHTLALAGNTERWAERIEAYREAGVDIPCPHLFTVGPDERASLLRGINALRG